MSSLRRTWAFILTFLSGSPTGRWWLGRRSDMMEWDRSDRTQHQPDDTTVLIDRARCRSTVKPCRSRWRVRRRRCALRKRRVEDHRRSRAVRRGPRKVCRRKVTACRRRRALRRRCRERCRGYLTGCRNMLAARRRTVRRRRKTWQLSRSNLMIWRGCRTKRRGGLTRRRSTRAACRNCCTRRTCAWVARRRDIRRRRGHRNERRRSRNLCRRSRSRCRTSRRIRRDVARGSSMSPRPWMSMSSGVPPCMPSQIFDKGSVLATIGGVGKFFRDAPGWRKNVLVGTWWRLVHGSDGRHWSTLVERRRRSSRCVDPENGAVWSGTGVIFARLFIYSS